jgi:CO/xanthine dehydrogenase FAD-binding subunit
VTRHAEPRIYSPESITDLLATLRQRPDATLFAGGTWLQNNPIARVTLDSHDLVWLGKTEELRRIFRTDRYLDIGAMSNLERMLHLEGNLIPAGLRQALRLTVPTPARSLATIGGNLAVPGECLNLLPLLAGWDCRLELRKQGGTRLIAAADFIRATGEPNLELGEIITKIRLPLLRWNHQLYDRIEGEPDSDIPSVAFAGFVRVHRNLIEEMRVMFIQSNHLFLFNVDLDAQLVGERLPLSARTSQAWSEECLKWLAESAFPSHEILAPRLRGWCGHFFRTIPPDAAD